MNDKLRHSPTIALLCAVLTAALACQQDTAETTAAPADAAVAEQSDAGGAPGVDGDGSSQVVARIGDRDVTMEELDDFIKDQLYERETRNAELRIYELRARYLDRLIGVSVTEEAAAAAGMPVADFLDAELVKLGEIPEEEVAAYFAENASQMGGSSLDDMREQIQSFLSRQRVGDVVESLKETAGAQALLPPKRVEVAGTGPSKGPADAPITIVEFSDFQCPYCRRAIPTIDEVLENYPNDVRLVFRHLPLDRLHPRARAAAEASVCADDQGRFWNFHDALFGMTTNLSDEDLASHAEAAGLDMTSYRTCLEDARPGLVVRGDSEAASRLGVSSTPAFFINGIPMRGAKPFSEFAAIIEAELARTASAAAAPSG